MNTSEEILEHLRSEYEADPKDLNKAIQLAQYYCDLGWFNEAIDLYKKLSDENPSSYTLLLEYGNTCYKKKDIKEAIALFTRLTELKPDRIEGWNNLGILQLQNGNSDAARNSISKVLELEPDNPGALLNMGNLFAEQKEYDTAIAYFERALHRKPDFPDAWFNLGNSLLAKNELDMARDAFEKALKYHREFPSAMKNLGFIYEKTGDLENAEKYYLQASDLNKADAGLRVNLGNIYFHQKRYDDSKKSYLKAVRLAPNELPAWMGLRHLALIKGDLSTFIRATLAILPRLNDEELSKSINILFELNQIQKAEDILDQADRLGRTCDELDLQRLLIYQRKESNPAKVAEIYKRLSGIPDKNEAIKKGLARYSLDSGEFDAAAIYIKQMQNPDSSAQSILWRALLAKNETDEAMRLIKDYNDKNPESFECWFLLARIEAERGNGSIAEKYLIRALENGFSSLEELKDCPELKAIFDSLASKEHNPE